MGLYFVVDGLVIAYLISVYSLRFFLVSLYLSAINPVQTRVIAIEIGQPDLRSQDMTILK